MRIRVCTILFSLGLLAAPLRAQIPGDEKAALNAFHDSVAKQRLLLRGLSADPTVLYQWTANRLAMQPSKVHTFAILEVNRVAAKHGQIEISAQRRTLFKDDQAALHLSSPTSVKLRIDLAGADPAALLPRLKSLLFYATYTDALADIPPRYQRLIPYDKTHPKRSDQNIAAETCGLGSEAYVDPTILKTVHPGSGAVATKNGLKGDVAVAFTVDDTGHVIDPWLASSSDSSLDEESVLTIEQYLFKPATCDGKPVSVPLIIESSYYSR